MFLLWRPFAFQTCSQVISKSWELFFCLSCCAVFFLSVKSPVYRSCIFCEWKLRLSKCNSGWKVHKKTEGILLWIAPDVLLPEEMKTRQPIRTKFLSGIVFWMVHSFSWFQFDIFEEICFPNENKLFTRQTSQFSPVEFDTRYPGIKLNIKDLLRVLFPFSSSSVQSIPVLNFNKS